MNVQTSEGFQLGQEKLGRFGVKNKTEINKTKEGRTRLEKFERKKTRKP